ncbi:hypothetical protein BGZ80_007798 [Entomortierella chlamydospora]|uniref:DDE-1 domain-containing protein n=1 Tax=Entomortierella chlamydospora TaxID=101097 RepID=A0A9P6SRM0_9FUNG|nr:hypothetical protein BGZ80_007798 [Entomortierella chlamydospora]
MELKYVEVFPFPPNTTSVFQPIDARVIAAFKRRYWRIHWEHALISDIENKASLLSGKQQDNAFVSYDKIFKINQLEAMAFVKAAWDEIMATTIFNCFQYTGIFKTPPPQESSDAPTSEATEGMLDLSGDNNSEEDEISAGKDIVYCDLGGDLGALDASVSDKVEEESYLRLPAPDTLQYDEALLNKNPYHQSMTTEELLKAVVDKDVDEDEGADNGNEDDKEEYEKLLQDRRCSRVV